MVTIKKKKLSNESIRKESFKCKFGSYEYLKLPFNLKGSPMIFQRTMDLLFNNLLYKFLTVYLDNLTIFSKSFSEHKQHLKVVIDLLSKHNFTFNIEKT